MPDLSVTDMETGERVEFAMGGREVIIELDGKGDMTPVVDIDSDTERGKTVVKFTVSQHEGAVNRAAIRIQDPASIEE